MFQFNSSHLLVSVTSSAGPSHYCVPRNTVVVLGLLLQCFLFAFFVVVVVVEVGPLRATIDLAARGINNSLNPSIELNGIPFNADPPVKCNKCLCCFGKSGPTESRCASVEALISICRDERSSVILHAQLLITSKPH